MSETISFDLLSAVSHGVINVCRLNEEDQFLLVLFTKKDHYLIPMIKTGKGTFAYVDTSYGEDKYEMISIMIEAMNKNKLYSGIYKFNPIFKDAPAHNHEIKEVLRGLIAGSATLIPDNFENEIVKDGYVFLEEKERVALPDYSAIRNKYPDLESSYQSKHERLLRTGVDFDHISDNPQTNYEFKGAIETIKHGNNCHAIIFEGPTGSGKSVAATAFADILGAPSYCVPIDGGTRVESLMGMIVPDTSGSGNRWKQILGPLLLAYVRGVIAILEEINFADPTVIAVLNKLIDDDDEIIYDGVCYKRAPGFFIIATCNPGYKGTDGLNVALKGRMVFVNFPSISKASFTSRMVSYSEKRCGFSLSRDFFDALYEFSMFVEKTAKSNQWHEEVAFSIRNAQRLCDCILSKRNSFEEFYAALSIEYFNLMSADNDNSEKLEAFKGSEDVKAQANTLYSLYGYQELKKVNPADTFTAFFSQASDGQDSAEKTAEDAVGRIIDALGLGL